jgi:hypothetical protein
LLNIEIPDKQKPQPLKDFGFLMDEPDAYAAWDAHLDSERIVMATGGGFEDQPDYWRQTIAILDTLYAEEYEKLDQWLESRKPRDERRKPRPKLPPNFE